MNYLTLGSSNVRVSRFCLGTMMFGGKTDAAESVRITRAAIAGGINFIDTADVYSDTRCEQILGELTGEHLMIRLPDQEQLSAGGRHDHGVTPPGL